MLRLWERRLLVESQWNYCERGRGLRSKRDNFSSVSADLAGADPAGADPAGADPTGADPTGADPAGADPAGANPAGANPAGANPAGADAVGADAGGWTKPWRARSAWPSRSARTPRPDHRQRGGGECHARMMYGCRRQQPTLRF